MELAELERKKEELERQKKSFAQSRKELSRLKIIVEIAMCL